MGSNSTKTGKSLKALGAEVGSKWGLISYDIPTSEENHSPVSRVLPSSLRRLAVRINLSVYVFRPVNRKAILGIVEALKKDHAEDMQNVWILPFAVATEDEKDWNEMVEHNIKEMLAKVPTSFKDSLERIRGKLNEMDSVEVGRKVEVAYNRGKKLIEDAQLAIATFAITGNVDKLIQGAAKKLEAAYATGFPEVMDDLLAKH